LHPASAFFEPDRAELIRRAGERGFAMIVGMTQGRALVGHAPLLIEGDLVRFHLSAANPLADAVSANGRVLALVTGEDAYVSPDWYGLTDQVPTWNYVSVEIEGPARRLARTETETLLDDLAARHEAPLAPKPPWTRAKMDPAKFAAMVSGIVGFEVTIERLEGTTKLSQNKPTEAIARVAAELAKQDDEGARAIARRMVRLREEG
jgi:transcriptional regulator